MVRIAKRLAGPFAASGSCVAPAVGLPRARERKSARRERERERGESVSNSKSNEERSEPRERPRGAAIYRTSVLNAGSSRYVHRQMFEPREARLCRSLSYGNRFPAR